MRPEQPRRLLPGAVLALLLAGGVPLPGCGAQPLLQQQQQTQSQSQSAPSVSVPAAGSPGAAPQSPAPDPAPVPASLAPPSTSSFPMPAPPAPARTAQAAQTAATATNLPDPTLALLAFADRIRGLSAAERARELGAANAEATTPPPLRQLRGAIVLMQNRAAADLARAQHMVQQVADSPSDDAAPLKPFARLLVARLAEQRRLEEQVDKLGNQLRDQQRRIDQLNQRLEAVRAIERSMAPPQPPASAAPQSPPVPAPN